MRHSFTPEQAEFITKNIVGRKIDELTQIFNVHFELELGRNQIRAFVKNRKLKSGVDCTFSTGNVPFNKGKKGMGGWEPTQFKKGHRAFNYKPIGTERVNGSDYVDIKIAAPNVWKAKHKIIWEEVNGTIPKNHVVIFGDGNRRNFETDNLILLSKKQLLIMNQNKLIQNDTELTKTGVIVADIYQRISDRKQIKK